MFVNKVDQDVFLRMLQAKDAEALFRLTDESRTVLREWLSWVDETKNIENSRAFIDTCFEQYNNRRGLTTGIFYKEQLAGVVGFHAFSWSNRIGYIGYWLGRDFQGRGIMTRSVRALIHYGFQDIKLNRIEIGCASGNKKSRAIPERLGFKQEGYIRQAEWLYDHYVDHIVYGMLADEWLNKEMVAVE